MSQHLEHAETSLANIEHLAQLPPEQRAQIDATARMPGGGGVTVAELQRWYMDMARTRAQLAIATSLERLVVHLEPELAEAEPAPDDALRFGIPREVIVEAVNELQQSHNYQFPEFWTYLQQAMGRWAQAQAQARSEGT